MFIESQRQQCYVKTFIYYHKNVFRSLSPVCHTVKELQLVVPLFFCCEELVPGLYLDNEYIRTKVSFRTGAYGKCGVDGVGVEGRPQLFEWS